MIYILGDSHVSLFSGKDELLPESNQYQSFGTFRVCREGAHTAYNLHKNGVKELIERITPKGSRLILSYGEIDCRGHLAEHNNVDHVVKRYLDFVKELLINYQVALFLPIPSYPDESSAVGTAVERNDITKEFHKICRMQSPVSTLSIFDDLVDSNSKTRTEFYWDTVHASQRAWPFMEIELSKLCW